MPALGFSLFLVAVGAILAFAVDFAVTGVSIATIGVILMAVGFVGMMLSLLFWTSFAPFGTDARFGSTRRDVTVSRESSATLPDRDVTVERRDTTVRHDMP
jgi:hypothetical protein